MVSIIIPIFKVEQYIERCLNSVVSQTFQDFELILVDDCSPDKSLEIAERILKDSSFPFKIVKHEKNGGLSAARNSGIKHAKGDYIFFIDSDDSLSSPNALENLVKYAVETNADVTYGNFQRIYPNKTIPSIYNKKDFFDKNEVIEDFCKGKIPVPAWNKLYKKDIFNEVMFKEGILNEDELLTYQLVFRNKSFATLGDITYDYYINQSTIMTSFNQNRVVSPVIIYETMVEEYYNLNLDSPILLQNLDHFAFKRYVDILTKDISQKLRKELYKRIKNAQHSIKGTGKTRYLYNSHIYLPSWLGMPMMKAIAKYYKKSRNI